MKQYDVDEQYLSFYPYYSRHGQDRFVNEHIFKGKRHGVFVDIGAYDGVESSNTLFFEESLGWSGICVEPLPNAFNKLKANRKNSIVINGCALDHNGVGSFMHVKPKASLPSKTDEKRTSNYEKLSGLVSFLSPWSKEIIDKIVMEHGGSKEQFEVKYFDINDILSMLGGKNIDLLSIDAEGSEFQILKGIDYTKHSIDVIIVEIIDDSDKVIFDFLNQVGYKKVKKVGYDWIFKKG